MHPTPIVRPVNIVHLDFETFYTREYSLSKMPTINYVRSPLFKVLGVAVAWNDEPSVYMSDAEFQDWAQDVEWQYTAVSAYNCAFDACILTEHYGLKPRYYIDPQSAARALLPTDSVALKVVAPLLGLGNKGDALVEGATESTSALADYAVQDNELCRGIYRILYPLISQFEQDIIHLHIRQSVEPTLVLDRAVLEQVRDDAVAERSAAIAASGYTEAALTSNQQFAQIVRDLGLDCPTKLSATTGEETKAFAKGDDEFVEFMLTYPEYLHIWNGRLAAKSNINIRRAEKFLEIADLGDTMPMPLKYHGAHTGRSSGCDGLNVQNLPNKYKSNLRQAIKAPKGYVIGVSDSSQIELRMNMYFCGQVDKVELLRCGGDIYKTEAAEQFGINFDEVTKDQRQFGKVVQLGSGFGMGAKRFRKYCAAGPLGLDPIYLSSDQAHTSVNTYRVNNAMVPAMWYYLDQRINTMTLPRVSQPFDALGAPQGMITFVHEAIVLPSGRRLEYPGLHQNAEGQWVYGIDKKVKFLWGGTVLENIIQAMARDVVFEQEMEIDSRFRVVSSTHDEVIFLMKESEADEGMQWAIDVMSKPPVWAPTLPVAAEGGYDYCYSK